MYKIDPKRICSTEDAPAKRSEILGVVLDSIKQVLEIENGYKLRFSHSEEDYVLVSDWLYLERKCNGFLRFNLSIESNEGPVWLEVSGPAGTKDFLETELGFSRWL
ncbi:MAG: hypothetical protein JKY67_02895 [Pseudomonadales bacterium]|nr:hypothetical protein [Pseudomonadales bacterium]